MSAWNSNGLTVRTSTTAGDTLANTDDVVIFTFAGAKAVALLGANNAAVQPGKVYRLSNAATGAVTLTPATGLIDGAATAPIAAGGTALSCRTIVSDGTQWRTISYTVGS